MNVKLSDQCHQKDFDQILPPLNIETYNNQELLMFTDLVPPLVPLWHVPHTDSEA